MNSKSRSKIITIIQNVQHFACFVVIHLLFHKLSYRYTRLIQSTIKSHLVRHFSLTFETFRQRDHAFLITLITTRESENALKAYQRTINKEHGLLRLGKFKFSPALFS
ncbi:hypothetical protein AHF37_07190 [Paragonimus kellicotti]|nr:hypothetical protein AHF37_07190 [Paragonimus kellicotti]